MWNQDIICPYCGHVNDDSEAFEHDSGEAWQCFECNKEFVLEIEYEPIYRTSETK